MRCAYCQADSRYNGYGNYGSYGQGGYSIGNNCVCYSSHGGATCHCAGSGGWHGYGGWGHPWHGYGYGGWGHPWHGYGGYGHPWNGYGGWGHR